MTDTKERINIVPLRQFVVDFTHEAREDDQQGIQKAVRRYHNRLANGTVPRSLFKKIGKELFVELRKFDMWLEQGGSENIHWPKSVEENA
jgi:hypothetical protein